MDLFRNRAASDWAADVTWRKVMEDSDAGQLGDDVPPTPQEWKQWRRMAREYQHASWLVRKVLPYMVATATALGVFGAWIYSHWKP